VRLVVPSRQPQLHIELKPEQLALYGLQAADVLDTVNAAFHGSVVAQLSQADRSVPVAVRIAGAGADPRHSDPEPGRAAAAARPRWRTGAAGDRRDPRTAGQRSIVNHQDGLRRQIVVAAPKTSNQYRLRGGRAQGDRSDRPSARRFPALWRRSAGAIRRRARRVAAAFGRGSSSSSCCGSRSRSGRPVMFR
jgi:hypothetical protein